MSTTDLANAAFSGAYNVDVTQIASKNVEAVIACLV